MPRLSLSLLPILLATSLLACSSMPEKKEPAVPRAVTFAVLAAPRLSTPADEASDDGPDPLDLLGGAITAWTTMSGAGQGYSAEQAVAGVLLGELFGAAASADDADNLRAILETLTIPTLAVFDTSEGGPELSPEALRKSFNNHGYDAAGDGALIKGATPSGKKYLRLLVLEPGSATRSKDIKKQPWLVGLLGRPLASDEQLDERLDLVLAPGETLAASRRGCLVITLPAIGLEPCRFFTVSLEPERVTVQGWPAQFEGDEASITALETLVEPLKK